MAVPNSKLFDLDRVFLRRIQMLERHMELDKLEVLEIGAYDRPTFVPEPRYSRFLDYRTTSELIELGKQQQGRHVDQIQQVDYVAKTNLLSNEVDRNFDLIVANHVIEHVPNLIEWLIEARKILNEVGYLFVSVPDRRFTFDYLRPETSFLNLIRRYVERPGKPTFWDILECRYLERPNIIGGTGWYPELLATRANENKRTFRQAFEIAKSQSTLPYCDVHCSVFTKDSFVGICAEMIEANFDMFHLVEVGEVVKDTLEFHVLLRANPNFDEGMFLARDL
jgi:SAM-dependent methyltransferase